MPGRWQIINGVKYPVLECRIPDEEIAVFLQLIAVTRSAETTEEDPGRGGEVQQAEEESAAIEEYLRLKEKKKFEDLEKEEQQMGDLATEEDPVEERRTAAMS